MKYPVYIPEITEKEKSYVNDCIDSTWISSRGKYIQEFEKMLADYVGVKHAVSVSNGTVALHVALLALDIKPGDEVIVPDFTYIATANAVLYVGAIPIIVDVDPGDWNISEQHIKAALSPKTKAIIVADIYGVPPDMDKICALAEKHQIPIIEDAAESLGASYKGRKAGSLADIATLSFFGNKTITTGEGGMILTNDANIANFAEQLKNQGNSPSVRYFHDVLGYNYRMTNIQAAIGVAQMERIDSILERKQKIYSYYKHKLGGLVSFQTIAEHTVSSNWMIGFLVDDEIERNGLMEFLAESGIESRPFFVPVHAMPYYQNMENEVSVGLSHRGISVPSYPMLTKSDTEFICDKIITFLTIEKKH